MLNNTVTSLSVSFFIDDEYLEHIQKEMVLYARLKSDIELCVTKEEILTILSILVVSRYCPLPSR